jgi:hypothetical protein
MGGGRTAALLSLFAKERAKRGGSCFVISLDESHNWLARTKAELAQLGLEDFCRLLYCPVRREDVTSHGYDLMSVLGAAAEDRAKFDFVVIDGPSGGWGRRNTFPSVLPYLAKQAHVVIDDADRVLERESIEIWLSNYAKFIRRVKFLPLPHGAAILTVDKE